MYGEGKPAEAVHEAERNAREQQKERIAQLDELTREYARADVEGNTDQRKAIGKRIEELEERQVA